MSRNINRRTFIKKSVAAGGAAAILPQTLFSSNIKKGNKIRLHWNRPARAVDAMVSYKIS